MLGLALAVSRRETASDPQAEFHDDYQHRYVEEVDRAIEDWKPSTTLLGKPAVAPFGEMVARRGVRKLAR